MFELEFVLFCPAGLDVYKVWKDDRLTREVLVSCLDDPNYPITLTPPVIPAE